MIKQTDRLGDTAGCDLKAEEKLSVNITRVFESDITCLER